MCTYICSAYLDLSQIAFHFYVTIFFGFFFNLIAIWILNFREDGKLLFMNETFTVNLEKQDFKQMW